MTLTLNYTAASDRGLVRTNNEDSAYAGAHLLVLADGMGGHAAGEVASQLMVEHLEHLNQPLGDNDMLALLGAAAEDGNRAIAKHVQAHPDTEGMGTTLTTLAFNGREFGMCHVGDSRCYRLRGGELTQLTKDDTYVQSLVDEGKLEADEVSSHPQKSLILKAYTGRPVEPTLTLVDAQPGDRLLLCSDGLSDPVTASTIEQALGEGSVDAAAAKLVELALRSGGPDNVTVVVAEVTEDGSAPADAPPVVAGALREDDGEPTHPDSAASRAAALNRQPPAQLADTDPDPDPDTTAFAAPAGPVGGPGAEPDADADADRGGAKSADPHADYTTEDRNRQGSGKRSRIGWPVIASIVAAIALVAGAGVWAQHYLGNTYYVATQDKDITIRKGADMSIFGRDLNSLYQRACLNKKGDLTLSNGECGDDAQPFKVTDLPASERGAVSNIGSGSYNEVQSELSALSDRALPPCRKSGSGEPDSEKNDSEKSGSDKSDSKKNGSDKSDSKKSDSDSDHEKDGKDASKGKDSASKDSYLSSPGVDCREVN